MRGALNVKDRQFDRPLHTCLYFEEHKQILIKVTSAHTFFFNLIDIDNGNIRTV